MRVERAVAEDGEATSGEAVDRAVVDRTFEARERQRLVEAQPEHDALEVADVLREHLELAGRQLSGCERRDVPRERRGVPAPQAPDRADGADPEPDVVAPEPDAEVVPRPQVARSRRGRSSQFRTSGSRRESRTVTTRSK